MTDDERQLIRDAFSVAKRAIAATEEGTKAAEHATIAAFSLAEAIAGFAPTTPTLDAMTDDECDEEWLEWCLKATHTEILDEALRRVLAKEVCDECQCPEDSCECPCVNCGIACGEHDRSDSGCPGVMFPGDVEEHLQWLKGKDLAYHLDDDPGEIFLDRLPADDLARIVTMHRKMWEHFDQHFLWEVASRVWWIEDKCRVVSSPAGREKRAIASDLLRLKRQR